MGHTVKRTFELTEEQSRYIDRMVESGRFASADEVMAEGLLVLSDQDKDVEAWLRKEVGPTVDAVRDGREATLSAEAMRESMTEYAASKGADVD